jgi:hypothetical protein
MTSKRTIIIGLLALTALLLAGCAGPEGPAGPAGEQGPPGEPGATTCTDCHDSTTTIIAAQGQWAESGHGMGDSYLRGTRNSCAGCHAGEGFTAAVAAGIGPDAVESGVTNPTRQTCRTCHEVHTTYTDADWALTTTDAVTLYASGVEFDGGKGNLCANCHQPRRGIAEAVDGQIEITSSHWGPHHGPQSTMLLGIGGAGVEGSPSAHGTMVADTCVSCHVRDTYDHTFEPDVAACTGCHADIEDFDLNGLQTEVAEMLDELEELLEAAGSLHDGHPVEGFYSEAVASATWNWIYISLEDSSLGVHNPTYTKAMLQAALDALAE